jgi:hypothetical protein
MLVAVHSPAPVMSPAQAVVLRAHRRSSHRRRRGLSGLFDTVASTIQTVEGWFPGSVSYRLNNPGNLLYAGQPGAVPHPITSSDGTVHVFAEFPTVEAGQAALDNQIALDASRGLSIAQFAQKYAPAQDSNDPASYAAQIAANAGLTVNDPLSAASNAGAVTPPPALDLSTLASNVFTDTGQPSPIDLSGVASVSPVAWAALAGIGLLYYAVAS